MGWSRVAGSALDRERIDPFIESDIREALIRLNPKIAKDNSLVDLAIPKVRAVIFAAQNDGLMRANEIMARLLRGLESIDIPGEPSPTPLKVIDFEDPRANKLVVSDEVTYGQPGEEDRYDIVLWVNGFPLVVGETKTPLMENKSWLNGAQDINDYYEPRYPEFFIANVLNFATEGKDFRYGPIECPPEMWLPWGDTNEEILPEGMKRSLRAAELLLTPERILEILQTFTLFSTTEDSGRPKTIKVIPRYPQVEAVKLIVQRAKDPSKKQGLIWHHQGSGKTFLSAFACGQLRREIPGCTVIVLLDRLELIEQTEREFVSAGVQQLKTAETKEELRKLLSEGDGYRGVILTTIFRFAEAGHLTDRNDVIVIADEAHRTQEGSIAQDMRLAIPDATFIGMTGTPISEVDRDTFETFGDKDDPDFILNRYSPERSMADGATLEIRVEAPIPDLELDTTAIDEEFDELAREENLSEEEKETLARKTTSATTLLKSEKRISAIAQDIVDHYFSRVAPLGLKAQVVAYDRDTCIAYYDAITQLIADRRNHLGLQSEATVVMTVSGGKDEPTEYQQFKRDRQEEGAIKARFRDYDDPLKFVIVTAKLLTGFDAPIEGVMYLDKPLRKHTLFQAMARTNRRWTNPETGQEKVAGLVVDYVGLGTQIAEAMQVKKREGGGTGVDVEPLTEDLADRIAKLSKRFESIDRAEPPYEILLQAQEIISDPKVKNEFAEEFLIASKLWEYLWPTPNLIPLKDDYKFLANIYKSVKPSGAKDALLWLRLGAKTLDLINENIVRITVRSGQTEDIRIDDETLAALKQLQLPGIEPAGPEKPTPEPDEIIDSIERRIRARLGADPKSVKYKSLAERLENLRKATIDGGRASIEWLQAILELARQVVEADRQRDNGAASADESLLPDDHIPALTQIFEEYKPDLTPEMLQGVVEEIDSVVVQTRYVDWQTSREGVRVVKTEIRAALKKFGLPTGNGLFERAYDYVAEHY